MGVQERDAFVRGGLARGLENCAERVAGHFKEIIPNCYSSHVEVKGFQPSGLSLGFVRIGEALNPKRGMQPEYEVVAVKGDLFDKSGCDKTDIFGVVDS